MKNEIAAFDQEVGKRLRHRRKTLSVTQQALARRLGITFQQVQKYEKGTSRVSASRLRDIAIVLEVPVTYFFDEVASMGGAMSESNEFVATPDGRSLVESFSKIADASVRRALTCLVEKLADHELKESNGDAMVRS